MPEPTIFLLGATGYIGGQILTALLALATPPSRITCLVRDEAKAASLESIVTPSHTRLTALIGSLADASHRSRISQAVEDHDVVINAATADEASWLEAVFEGIRARKQRTGKEGLFIHTSGTGMFHDDARGAYATEKIYTDYDQPDSPYLSISSLPPTVRHRALNLYVIDQEEKEGICKVYIVVPSHIWGYGQGEVFDKGISHRTTISFPWLVGESLDAGQAMVTGKGLNRWDHVHITDTADLYTLVYQQALLGAASHGSHGYHLGCAGDYNLKDISFAIGEEMFRLGLASTAELKEFAQDDERYRVIFTGTNARGVAERSFALGWKPRYDKREDLLEYIKEEVRTMAGERSAK